MKSTMAANNTPKSYYLNGNGATGISSEDLDGATRSLLQNTVDSSDQVFGFGSMSCSIYDTAWVSLVTKIIDGKQQWLFPECFDFLLHTQGEDGSWGKTASQIDGILSTGASLLSLLRHRAEPLQLENLDIRDTSSRISRAVDSLGSQLQSWSITSTVHVGFEVIVPTLLDLLSEEDPSIRVDFDGFKDLMKISAKKLCLFKPEYLYGDIRSTIFHSLEAFIGKVDFDRITHHTTSGSMMGSPSSTAAYLMNASRWDDKAEMYLRHVVGQAAGKGSGGVPSAYPSTYFEYSWILSTLLTSGFSPSDLDGPGLQKMTEVLSQALENEGGTIGFAPFFMADVDDTAKAILSLKKLGRNASAAKMIERFETKSHFKTYPSERDPSFSANCNVLLALLHQDVPRDFSTQIASIIEFLCNYWWSAPSNIKDKWNLSHLYPRLLFVEAVTRFVYLIEKGELPALEDQTMQSKVAVCLYQACYRTLLEQFDDGSWNNSIEETAYGTLILSEARRLVLFVDFEEKFSSAIDRSVAFLQTSNSPPEFLWIEKVSYRSPVLTETYKLAALRAATIRPEAYIGSSLRQDTSVIPKFAKFLLMTPIFKGTPEWEVSASMVEGTLFRPIVRALRLSVFTRKGVEEDKYFDVIPLAWPSMSNCKRIFAPPFFLFEGMMAALLNYQVDEFMEAVADINYANHVPELRKLIDDVIDSISDEASREASATNGTNGTNGLTNGSGAIKEIDGHHPDIGEAERQEVLVPLQKFVTRALKHPAILSASPWDRKNMTCELRIYLQTHVTQNEDNALLKQGKWTQGVMREHFLRWVSTTSADHTSATYTYSFVCCLLSTLLEDGKDCFPTTQEKYYGYSAGQHLAAMCRMYNDHGSAIRDRDELNVNSIDFPEFELHDPALGNNDIVTRQASLFEIAQYERSCIEYAFERLANHSADKRSTEAQARKSRQMDFWRLFYNVTDLWGQMYVLRDIGSRLTVGTAAK
ncbi:Ent-kaurene synthase [Hypoxylon trugodes]|uniref:Ent-kaurene synthase n=1 Tax=Hypoxylon trugodes TaxID=326681 RepID=UPI002198013C|nr:Ent-kaurene synthase [Hypoxylon trugodes]KAI1390886.1 Ent-kaurene synthase [Hypoxylon trugodes]